jgi:hypothetical protein
VVLSYVDGLLATFLSSAAEALCGRGAKSARLFSSSSRASLVERCADRDRSAERTRAFALVGESGRGI